MPVVPEAKAKARPHPKGNGQGLRAESPAAGGKRTCYFYLVKRDCQKGKECHFSDDTKLREKAEKNGPLKSSSASPKGQGVPRFPEGKLQEGGQVSLLTQVRVRFSDTTYIKPYVIEVREGTGWRKVKDPYQRHSNPRLCDEKIFLTNKHKVFRRILRLRDAQVISYARLPTRDASSRRRREQDRE